MRSRRFTPRSLISVIAAVIVLLAAGAVTRMAMAATPSATGAYNYAEALQKAVWFYDAQREGVLPSTNRVPWRADSFLSDGADVGLDLVGGFADAGDHLKATFPLAHALGALAWGMIEWPEGYTKSGQTTYALSNLRWGMDYLIKANPSATKLVTEVADPSKDHQVWAAAEVQTYTRQTYIMNASTCWGADLADSVAATFAAASMVFKASDSAYAETLLTHAKQLYATTESTTKSKYDDCTPIVKGFYNSWSGYSDELVWGSLWLYRATGDTTYLDNAKAYYSGMPKNGQSSSDPIKYSWTYDWDDKTAASYILMATLTDDVKAKDDSKNWTDFNAGNGFNGGKVTQSPGGQAFYGSWGSLRYSSGAAFLALILADSGKLDATRNQQLHDFAVKQINYILGDNPLNTSYMVGFGQKYIKRPHHRTAHGPWSNHYAEPVENRHTLYGALIGGPPAANDVYGEEDRNAYQKAEVALDYNAAFTSALARMVSEYGGTALSSLPDDPKDDEFYMTASLNQVSTNFVEIKTVWHNHTAWPARVTDNVSFRYYFTVTDGQKVSDITFQSAYQQCASPTGPTQHAGDIYYVTISCAGQAVAPIGQSESRRENQFRIVFPGPHDYTKDWSYAGVSAVQATPAKVTNIPMYDGATKVWGQEPGTTPPASSSAGPPVSPSASPSRPASPSAPPSRPVSPSAPPSPSASSPAPSSTPTGCKVTYKPNTWSTGFTADVRITNTGTTPINGWSLAFTLPAGQTITSMWNAANTGTSGAVTAKNLSYNSTIASGGSTVFGFQASLSGAYSSPTAFTLNGLACTIG